MRNVLDCVTLRDFMFVYFKLREIEMLEFKTVVIVFSSVDFKVPFLKPVHCYINLFLKLNNGTFYIFVFL